jgi:hypothetical protein
VILCIPWLFFCTIHSFSLSDYFYIANEYPGPSLCVLFCFPLGRDKKDVYSPWSEAKKKSKVFPPHCNLVILRQASWCLCKFLELPYDLALWCGWLWRWLGGSLRQVTGGCARGSPVWHLPSGETQGPTSEVLIITLERDERMCTFSRSKVGLMQEVWRPYGTKNKTLYIWKNGSI